MAKKYRILIADKSPETIKNKLIEVTQLLNRVVESTQYFRTHYGANNKKVMEYWLNKGEEWISENVKKEE